MKVIHNSDELRDLLFECKKEGKKISYVPTMGYLHEGHLSLMEKAKELGDILVVSIFVNPAQFNDPSDLKNYPVDTEGDVKKCEEMMVDFVFLPKSEDIYPDGIPNVRIMIPYLMDVLCGKSRPGHFEGILLVLSRLFHFVMPDFAVFGKKDYQQYLIVKEFVKIFAFPIAIIGMETVREKDGLAMSSRNARLTPKTRESANLIPRSLNLAEKLIREGEKNILSFKEILIDMIGSGSDLKLDYLEVMDPDTLEEKNNLDGRLLIAIAVFAGNVRLIDNKVIEID